MILGVLLTLRDLLRLLLALRDLLGVCSICRSLRVLLLDLVELDLLWFDLELLVLCLDLELVVLCLDLELVVLIALFREFFDVWLCESAMAS